MKLTPEMLVTSYAMLQTCLPFRRWKMPHADSIVFAVTRRLHEYGEFSNIPPTISISSVKNKTLLDLTATMSHEMAHLYLYQNGFRRDWDTHGPKFQKVAARICRELGFDPKTF